MAVWGAIHSSLAPVIGARGSAALYHRTLHLARASHPWLAAVDAAAAQPGEFEALRAALAQQAAVDASAAHDSMLRTFLDLLTTLIGAALTERLLHGVWAPSSGGPPAKDKSR